MKSLIQKHIKNIMFGIVCLGSVSFGTMLTMTSASAESFEGDLLTIQTQWATANYELKDKAKLEAFELLAKHAHDFVKSHPNKAEPLIWEAIVRSTWAGAKGGLGALSLVKDAKELLEKAIAIDPNALDGSAYTSLGSLYYQVPGWPIGFGDDKKAARYLQQALTMNPEGIDPNYFYADYLKEEGQKQEAKRYFEKALAAPERPNRSLADAGRRNEIKNKLAELN